MIVHEGLRHKAGKAEVLHGGVIVDVSSADHAVLAEQSGACAVRVIAPPPPAFSPVALIRRVMNQISIPVMAQVSIGHFVEARVLQELEVDFIDESESLRPADRENYIDKRDFDVPFLCGAETLGDALRRIAEGAALIRPLSPRGESELASDVRLLRGMHAQIKGLSVLADEELYAEAKSLRAPAELVTFIARHNRLPVPIVSSASIASPADAALMRSIGAETLFVSHMIFASTDPPRLLKAIVSATASWEDVSALVAACDEAGSVLPNEPRDAGVAHAPNPNPSTYSTKRSRISSSPGAQRSSLLSTQPLFRRVAAPSRQKGLGLPSNLPRKPQL